MKKRIICIFAGIALICSSAILTSSQLQAQPGGLTITNGTSNGKITEGVVYTKAQVIAKYGTPHGYKEWETDGGMGFECQYGANHLYFHPERGFGSFVLENNNLYMDNVNLRIGYTMTQFLAAPYEKTETVLSSPAKIHMRFWPEGSIDYYLDVIFEIRDGVFKITQISYWPPV